MAISSTVAAQQEPASLADRIVSLGEAERNPDFCRSHFRRANALNAPDLLRAALACEAVNLPIEASFLLVVGQVRAMADMALTVPASRADSDAQISLYGLLYARLGGPGSEEVLRNSASLGELLRNFDAWSPTYGIGYDPGWATRRRSDESEYRLGIEEAKASRRRQLVEVARLYSDESYYALHRRFRELMARNNHVVRNGTPDGELFESLSRQMHERSVALGVAAAQSRPEAASEERAAPADSRAADEIVFAGDDATSRRCAELAERQAIAGDLRVRRVLVTRSATFGTIWRADLDDPRSGPIRITCSEGYSSTRPLDAGREALAPLSGEGVRMP